MCLKAVAPFAVALLAAAVTARAGEHYKPPAAGVVVNGALAREAGNGFVTSRAVAFGVTPAIHAPPQAVAPRYFKDLEERNENERVKFVVPGAGAGAGDGTFTDPLLALSRASAPLTMPAPSLTFLGQTAAEACPCLPPDTNGDVGPNHYVQATNVRVSVYDKAGTRVFGAALQSAAFFSGLPANDACRNSDDGDPVVLYDPLADRWLVSQFEIDDVPGHQCIAISATPDPAGAYYAYDFLMPNAKFQDYPHYGVWPDGYYLTTNQFEQTGDAFLGDGLFAFDRAKMLAGDPSASYVYVDLATIDPSAGGLLPTDFDGLVPPPPNLPNRALEFRADEFGNPIDAIRIYELVPDFANPAASTLTVRSDIALAPFDARSPQSRHAIEQGGAAPLDAIADRLMFRVGYRNLGSAASPVNSWVGNFTVNVSGVTPSTVGTFQAGIRWFELRSADAPSLPSVRDEGTQNLAPGDGAAGVNDWMGSIAQDGQGNLALGFSQSSAAQNANIVIAGRSGNATGAGLNAGEALFFAASGAQTSTSGRWGDYSAMTVDPTDDCTFWYTQEYYAGTSNASWSTRIGKFAFPGCAPPPRGAIAASLTNCDTGQPLAGVLVTVPGGYRRVTKADGTLESNIAVPPGSYVVTASMPEFTTITSGALNVANGGVATFAACLTGVPRILAAPAPAIVMENYVPANGAPDPGETLTVSLPLRNVGGADTASLTATLLATGGVTAPGAPQDYGVVATNGPAVARMFAFTASGACGATITLTVALADGAKDLGTLSFPMTLGTRTIAALPEGFDGVAAPALPAGWTSAASGAGAAWVASTARASSAPNDAFAAEATDLGEATLTTPPLDVPAAGAQLSFRNLYNLEASDTNGYDGVVLELSVAGAPFADITSGGNAFLTGGYSRTISSNYGSAIAGRQAWSGLSAGTAEQPAYVTSTIDLPAAAAGQGVRLRWRAVGDNGFAAAGAAGARIDDVMLSNNFPVCAVPNTAPTIAGPPNQSFVEDATTGLLAVTVSDGQSAPGSLVLTASSSNPALVPNSASNLVLGGSGASRTIAVVPAPNASGAATITLAVSDGLLATSMTFDVDVLPVNDAPSFATLGGRVHFAPASGPQSVPGFVTSANLGPLEATQTVLGYTVTELSDSSGVVSGAAIANDGTLSYGLSGATGAATLRAVLRDSGGTANGGVDTSVPVDFSISVIASDAVFANGFE